MFSRSSFAPHIGILATGAAHGVDFVDKHDAREPFPWPDGRGRGHAMHPRLQTSPQSRNPTWRRGHIGLAGNSLAKGGFYQCREGLRGALLWVFCPEVGVAGRIF